MKERCEEKEGEEEEGEEKERDMKERCVEKEGEGGGGECLQGQLSPVHGRLSPTVSGGSQRLLPARKRRNPFTLTLLLTFLDCIWISKLNILFQVEKTWIINSQNTTHHRTPLSPNNSHCLHSIASIYHTTHIRQCAHCTFVYHTTHIQCAHWTTVAILMRRWSGRTSTCSTH